MEGRVTYNVRARVARMALWGLLVGWSATGAAQSAEVPPPPGESAEVPAPGESAEVPPSGESAEVPPPSESAEVPPPGESAEVPAPGESAEVPPAAAPTPQVPVARVGSLPPALEAELEFVLGSLIEAASVRAAFMSGAPGALYYDGRQVLAFRPSGASRAFPYVPSSQPQERQLAEAIARWLGGAGPAAYPAPGPASPASVSAAYPATSPGPGARPAWRQVRSELRRTRPWRLRLAFLTLGTPRDSYGEGPTAGRNASLVVFPGFGAQVSVSRYLSSLFRLDLLLTLAWVGGNWNLDPQGPEGSLGGALMVVGRGKTRLGGGVGLDLVLAREAENYGDDDFGWLSTRLRFVGEVGWSTRAGTGISIQLAPTVTHVPYAKRFHPGVLFTVGAEFGVGGASVAAASVAAADL